MDTFSEIYINSKNEILEYLVELMNDEDIKVEIIDNFDDDITNNSIKIMGNGKILKFIKEDVPKLFLLLKKYFSNKDVEIEYYENGHLKSLKISNTYNTDEKKVIKILESANNITIR